MQIVLGALMGLLLLLSAPAWGAELTKSQEGRREVGKCYSACMGANYEGSLGAFVGFESLYWDNWRDSGDWTKDQWNSFLSSYRRTYCTMAQYELIVDYTCWQGCIDVERAYGTATSSARNAFRHEILQSISRLKNVGLWKNTNRDAPEPGTAEFNAACSAWWGEAATSADPALQEIANSVKRGGGLD